MFESPHLFSDIMSFLVPELNSKMFCLLMRMKERGGNKRGKKEGGKKKEKEGGGKKKKKKKKGRGKKKRIGLLVVREDLAIAVAFEILN